MTVASTGDVSSASKLEELLEKCTNLPPIKGCINCAMALQDYVFDGMTFEQWNKAVQTKVGSSWNLHAQLPRDIDFLILLSSLSGVYGSMAQSNYAAGCTFQDALARYRTAVGWGKTSVSLDLGRMQDIGIIAENAKYQVHRRSLGDMVPLYPGDLISLLDRYCDPALPAFPQLGGNDHQSQVLEGAATPLNTQVQSHVASFMEWPFVSGFAAAAALQQHTQVRGKYRNSEEQDSPVTLFREAAGTSARAAVVVACLTKRLSRLLSVSEEDIDPRKPLSDYGVDSLMAVELRNWIMRDFKAVVAVFKIMGSSTSITAIGALVVDTSMVS